VINPIQINFSLTSTPSCSATAGGKARFGATTEALGSPSLLAPSHQTGSSGSGSFAVTIF
jgi:hypothetical protein